MGFFFGVTVIQGQNLFEPKFFSRVPWVKVLPPASFLVGTQTLQLPGKTCIHWFRGTSGLSGRFPPSFRIGPHLCLVLVTEGTGRTSGLALRVNFFGFGTRKSLFDGVGAVL